MSLSFLFLSNSYNSAASIRIPKKTINEQSCSWILDPKTENSTICVKINLLGELLPVFISLTLAYLIIKIIRKTSEEVWESWRIVHRYQHLLEFYLLQLLLSPWFRWVLPKLRIKSWWPFPASLPCPVGGQASSQLEGGNCPRQRFEATDGRSL